MSTYRTEGIILRRSDFGEANLLLRILSRTEGKVEAVGRSARKAQGKLKGHLEPFLYADFVLVRGRRMDTVANSFILDPFLGLRGSLAGTLTGSVLLEITDRLTLEGYRDERVFLLLLASLRFIEAHPEDRKALWLLLLFFEVNFLGLSGFRPQTDHCVLCQEKMTPGRNYFSFSLGGVLDEECAKRIPDAVRVADDVIKLLRFLALDEAEGDYGRALESKLSELYKLRAESAAIYRSVILMKGFIEFNTDTRINSLDTLCSFAREGI